MDYDSQVSAVCEILSESYGYNLLPDERKTLKELMMGINREELTQDDVGYFSCWPFKLFPNVVLEYCSSLLGFKVYK